MFFRSDCAIMKLILLWYKRSFNFCGKADRYLVHIKIISCVLFGNVHQEKKKKITITNTKIVQQSC